MENVATDEKMRPIRASWDLFERRVLPHESAEEREGMKLAFYAGAITVLELMAFAGAVPKDVGVAMVTAARDEVDAFDKEYGVAKMNRRTKHLAVKFYRPTDTTTPYLSRLIRFEEVDEANGDVVGTSLDAFDHTFVEDATLSRMQIGDMPPMSDFREMHGRAGDHYVFGSGAEKIAYRISKS